MFRGTQWRHCRRSVVQWQLPSHLVRPRHGGARQRCASPESLTASVTTIPLDVQRRNTAARPLWGTGGRNPRRTLVTFLRWKVTRRRHNQPPASAGVTVKQNAPHRRQNYPLPARSCNMLRGTPEAALSQKTLSEATGCNPCNSTTQAGCATALSPVRKASVCW